DGWLRCGSLRFHAPPGACAALQAGRHVALYLRPEDRVIEDLPADAPLRCTGTVQHVEFLGGNCMAELMVDDIGQPLHLQFSLNQMPEFDVREGRTLQFALRGDRVRVFPAALS